VADRRRGHTGGQIAKPKNAIATVCRHLGLFIDAHPGPGLHCFLDISLFIYGSASSMDGLVVCGPS